MVCGAKELIEPIYHYREINGATLDPWAAYLLLRGMKTLKLRVVQQEKNALAIAQYLQQQELVEDVFYPGLATHTNHDIAKNK